MLLIVIILLLGVVSQRRHNTTYKAADKEDKHPTTTDSTSLHYFDPNEVDYKTLIAMGVDRESAVGIIRWREAGKIYRIKEDVALCYNISDSAYIALEPYIVIGEKYRYQKKEYHHEHHAAPINLTPFRIDTATTEYLRSIGFSSRQAALIIRYRDIIGGYRNFEEFAECYAVDSAMAERLRPYVIFPTEEVETESDKEMTTTVNINRADSATLVKLRGIGAKSAKAIIEYRELLGGYHDILQIQELNIITDENFSKFSQQIYCDSADIQKIYINVVSPEVLKIHPYISNRMLERIINHRELKGGWSTIEEMIDSKIFTAEQAARIAPYFDFRLNIQEDSCQRE